jgi:hypothetical protein
MKRVYMEPYYTFFFINISYSITMKKNNKILKRRRRKKEKKEEADGWCDMKEGDGSIGAVEKTMNREKVSGRLVSEKDVCGRFEKQIKLNLMSIFLSLSLLCCVKRGSLKNQASQQARGTSVF